MSTLYDNLRAMSDRPEPFSVITTSDLWTDEHISKQMLWYHLNEEVDLSSRNAAFIDQSVEWMSSAFAINASTRIADFGCGPGLYAQRLARKGAKVTGIDFSGRSIAYAREQANKEGLEIEYLHQDYLDFQPEQRYDLILLIFCDFCALGPGQRSRLLKIFADSLAPGGQLLFDVQSVNDFNRRKEGLVYARNLMDGFWSPDDYFAFQQTFLYQDERISLDKYTIIEAKRTRTIYNWLQYYTREALEAEINRAGFAVERWLGDVAGSEFDATRDLFALVAQKA